MIGKIYKLTKPIKRKGEEIRINKTRGENNNIIIAVVKINDIIRAYIENLYCNKKKPNIQLIMNVCFLLIHEIH